MRRLVTAALLLLVAVLTFAQSTGKQKLAPDTSKDSILNMDPANIDPSELPLDRVDQLHSTGTPPQSPDITTWRLKVRGKAVGKELSLSYADLLALPAVKKRVILICPGFFADYVEWEGVLLSDLLEMAKVRPDFVNVTFRSSDDSYTGRFSRDEATKHFLILAFKVNGQALPIANGYPVRLVAEDFYGGRWVKWITDITVE
jgi:DMSO/TMAO reductase YedYZ molybdopterin-dependent catalytic subunit